MCAVATQPYPMMPTLIFLFISGRHVARRCDDRASLDRDRAFVSSQCRGGSLLRRCRLCGNIFGRLLTTRNSAHDDPQINVIPALFSWFPGFQIPLPSLVAA